ncbi:MAG TPA: prolyl oligopeptidase family serine peptidase [Polyangium sp.]|nr:prolyl oligopeptidase family serine peptidase [Polyangium sp.]
MKAARASWFVLPALTALSCTPPQPPPTPKPVATVAPPAAPKGPAYPVTKREEVTDVYFSTRVTDPYRWLEDGNSPDVQAWVKAQDDLTRAELNKLAGREELTAKLKSLSYLEIVRPPVRRGARSFYVRKEASQEKPIVYVRDGDKGAERVLLDPTTMSSDGSTSLGAWVPSYDGKFVAYVAHPNNADAGVVRVRDVATGKDSAVDVIEGGKYAIPRWTPKNDGFYYIGLPTDPNIKPADLPGHSEVKFHKLGQPASADELILEKNADAETELDLVVSRDGRFLVVMVIHGGDVNGIKFLDNLNKKAGWIDLVKDYEGSMSAFAHENRIYLRTTQDAPRGKLVVIDPAKPEKNNWKDLVPESPDSVLEDVHIVGGHLSLTYLHKASSVLSIHSLDGKKIRDVTLPGIGSSSGVVGQVDEDTAYYSFTSYTYPGSIYEIKVKTGESKEWYKSKAPVNPAPFVVEQVFYPSKDKTQISMFVVRRKDAPLDGSSPLLLTGYGGFNNSETPGFSPTLYTWLEAGGTIAMPNLRGGAEYGEAWHKGGMLGNKQNVFDDFISGAEWLIKNGYTKSEKIAAWGGSNGGLLVAAVAVQRPELFKAILCAVPVIDMLRYPLFGDGKTWVAEYGSPQDEPMFRALLAYSPYHNVKKVPTGYPAFLMLSADADDRVHPMHAWKMTAALQAAQTTDKPILMRVERHAGHRGADSIKSRVEQSADMLAFAFHMLDHRFKLP